MSDFKFVQYHTIRDTPDYFFDIEEFKNEEGQQFLLAHLRFNRFSPAVLKRGLHDWRLFRTCVTAPIFAVCDDGDYDKWRRFVSLFDFKPTNIDVPCNNGAVRQLFISTVSNVFKSTADN